MNTASTTLYISIVLAVAFFYISFIAGTGVSGAQTQSENVQVNEAVFDVLFESDNNDISSDTKEGLNHHAETLINNPGTVAVLEGYSDSTGSDDYNLELSGKRAESVKDYLISQGVPSENISVLPKGGTDRFSPGETQEALAGNRRVRVIYEMPIVIAKETVSKDGALEETGDIETSPGETPQEDILETDDIGSELAVVEAPRPVSTPKPLPPPPSLLDSIGSEINNTAPGEIVFDPPEKMQLESPYLVEAIVSDSFIDELTRALKKQPEVQDLKLSRDILVLLSGKGFEVQPVEDSFNSRDLFPDDHGARSESVSPAEDIKWQWYVTPVKAGYQPLLLSVIIDIEEPLYDQMNTEYEMYRKVVDVRGGVLRSLVGSYWLTSFVVLLVIAVVSWVILGKFNMI
jgi:OmpA family